MLPRMFSWLRNTKMSNHPARKSQQPRLNLEILEAREVPAIIYGLTSSNELIRFDSATPTSVSAPLAVTGLGANQRLVGIDFRPRTGQLVGSAVTTLSANNSLIFTYNINPLTGAAAFIGATAATLAGAGDVETGYDFNPTVDRIRYVNINDENARLNPNNATLAGDDTDLTPAATTTIIGAAYDRNTDRQNPPGTITTTLFVIDRNDSQLAILGGLNGTPSPNGGVVTDIGALGFTLNAANDGGFDIQESLSNNNGGLGTAFAALTDAADNLTRLYTINLTATTNAATRVGLIGAGTTELLSIAVVPEGVLIVGSGLGANGDVRLLDPTTGALRTAPIIPFAGFRGGVRVAAGDVTGDGIPDAVVSANAPQGHVKVFDGITGAQVSNSAIGSFFAFVNFQGTVNVGSGDFNGDGVADVIVGANGVNGHVKVFNGVNGAELVSFLAYANFQGNMTVAAADFNNDGIDEIVTAAAINGHVKVFNADGTAFLGAGGTFSSFLAFPGFTTGDIHVAAGDVSGDGRADVVVSSGLGSRGHIKVFTGTNGAELASFFVYGANVTTGAFVGLADANGDGLLDIRVTPDIGQQADVLTFSGAGGQLGTTFPAFAGFQGGATIGGARF